MDIGNVNEATTVMRTLVEDLLRQGIPTEDFQRIKHSALLALDIGYETNADIAAYYEEHIRSFRDQGAFPDLEAIVESIDEDAALRVARQYLTLDRALWYEASPTLTFSQLWLIAAIPLAVGAFVWFWRGRRRAVSSESRINQATKKDPRAH